jgi:hypothetical protein
MNATWRAAASFLAALGALESYPGPTREEVEQAAAGLLVLASGMGGVTVHPTVAWLEAELARVEQIARALPSGPWRWFEAEDDGGEHDDLMGSDGKAVLSSGDVDGYRSWVWRHDAFGEYLPLIGPDAVLRRVAADRQILTEHANDYGDCAVCAGPEWYSDDAEGNREWSRPAIPWPCRTVLLLAEGWGWTEGIEDCP